VDDLVASAPAKSGDPSPPQNAPGGADDGEENNDDSSGSFHLGDVLAPLLIQILDRDKDGKLTKDEWIAGVKQFFKNQDKERTGKLAQKEISDGLTAIIPTPRGFWGATGQRFGLGELFAPEIVKRSDANKDGKVTEPELVAAAESLFQEYDMDKQGKLSEKEIAKAINQVGTSSVAPGASTPRGPDLGTVGVRHNMDWLKSQIRQPKSHKKNARMPSFEGKIKDDDLDALVEYLASLK
jgi:Ca2+-binding EF-hand superfamily protein